MAVAWDGGAFASPPFLEFFARTNLVAGTWSSVGWIQAEMGETNLDVVVEADRLPGRASPSAAFFSVVASDGLVDARADDDGDGVLNAVEQARGTNPRRADTDGDGYSDGEELGYAETGRELPDFDLSGLPDVFAGTLPYATYPSAIAVDLPFAVEVAGRRSTRAVVHFCGTATFPEAGSAVNAQNDAFGAGPSSLYAASHAVVAAYGFAFLPMGYSGSQLRTGIVHASNGRWFVAEWRDMQDPMGVAYLTFGAATFQLAVAEADPGTVHVRYLSLTGDLDGTGAIVGAHGFDGTPDLLVADGVSGSVSNGDVISYLFGTGTDPLDPDTDGDGLRDGWEASHGMDPRVPNGEAADLRHAPDADPDNDGLTNRQESELGTDPFQSDSDGDGLDDGWEAAHGFDPATHNDDTPRTDDNSDADPDGDGLTNREECVWRTDPGAPDTDRDGVPDGTEVSRNSDPVDAEDGGRPNSRVSATLFFGDHSTSQSEKYVVTLTPIAGSGSGGTPAVVSRISARYDGCTSQPVPLKPGWRYEVRLDHSGSNPAYTGTPKPDYDYTLEFSQKPENVLLDDPQGLFGVHSWDSGPFLARDKAATVTVCRLEFVTPAGDPVAAPKASSGPGQNEFTYDDATSSLDLSLRVRVLPSLPAEWTTRTGTFSLPSIEGAALEWEGGSAGSATATGNEFTLRAVYRGYPTHNDGFGRKTATFMLGGMTVSQDFEMFFPSDGTHHPVCSTCPRCPNWFYYWREGGVCIPDGIVYADLGPDIAGAFSPHTLSIRLASAAVLERHEIPVGNWERQIMEMPQLDPDDVPVVLTNWTPAAGRFLVGAAGAGIRSVAATIRHEMRHREIFLSHPENAANLSGVDGDIGVDFDDENPDDEDCDGVWNVDEISGRWGVLSNEKDADTYRMNQLFEADPYSSYGDNEIRARLGERGNLESAYHVDRDWCNPGCQSKIRRGPMTDESIGGVSR